jgi:glucose/arabinose dehydrogenase
VKNVKSSHVVVVAVMVLAALAVTVKADPPFTVVVGGLQNPRGLTFGPGGRLYVAQAGAGKISEIRKPSSATPVLRDIVTGLPAEPDGPNFVGVDGISALGNGNIAAIMAESEAGGGPPLFGHLLEANVAGQWRDVANVGNYNYAWSAEHVDLAPNDFPDSNPYGVLAVPGGVYVADAGTNTLNFVKANGDISILAYFPNNPIADATPTCIAQGPDGALYVGTLALRDSIATRSPKAIVYRVDPSQADPDDLNTILTLATPWATGVWPINGCAFGPDGSFYASQLFTRWPPPFSNGDVVKIPFATPAVHTFMTGGALTAPGGVAVAPDGTVYVSNGSAFAPEGQVVRLANR